MPDEFAYVGIKPCGCMVFAMVDTPGREKDIAKEVARCIRDGLKVERLPVERVRQEFKRCKCSISKETSQLSF
mgnify:CR=1 FL=1